MFTNKKINLWNTEFKLVLFAIIFLIIFKIIFIADFLIIIKTFILDLFFLSFFFLLSFHKKIYSKILFYIFYFITFATSIFYYFYYFDISIRGNILRGLSFEFIYVLFKTYLSFTVILSLLIGIILIILLSIYFYKLKKLFVFKNHLIIYYIAIFIIFFILVIVLQIYTHPYISFFYDLKTISQKIDVEEIKLEDYSFFIHDKVQEEYFLKNANYKKIIVFLGEEWMFSDLLNEQKQLDQENFFNLTRHKSHYYNNYFTTNQDSRTSIYSMLSGYFIPYEAYLEGYIFEKYLNIIENKKNIISQFNFNNFQTAFVVSSIEVPDVSYPFPWTIMSTLEPEIYNSGKYYCPDIFANETACEDLSVIDDLKDIIKNNDDVFIYQEFIFGHSYKHIRDLKTSRTKYYNNYMLEIYNFLKDENLLDQTIIIVTADHGSRAFYNMLGIEGYQVPFIVISNNLEYKEDYRLFSHLDFKDILYKYVYGIDNIKENDVILTIGSTNSNLIGFKTKENDFGIINISSKKALNYNLDNNNIKQLLDKIYSIYKYRINQFI